MDDPSGESSVVGHDLEEARDLGLVEDDALFREEQADLLRELGECVGDLDGERGVDEGSVLSSAMSLWFASGSRRAKSLGVLLGEHRLPREGAARGLFGQQSLDLGERDRLGHLGAPERGVGADEVDRMRDEDLALSSVEEFHLVGTSHPPRTVQTRPWYRGWGIPWGSEASRRTITRSPISNVLRNWVTGGIPRWRTDFVRTPRVRDLNPFELLTIVYSDRGSLRRRGIRP